MSLRAVARTQDQLTEGLRDAITNELITRRRVEALEELFQRGFWGRVRWLFLGR